jgi:hypothetical protein
MDTWRFRARCIQPGRAGVAVGRALLEGKLHYNQGQLLPREDMFFFFFFARYQTDGGWELPKDMDPVAAMWGMGY